MPASRLALLTLILCPLAFAADPIVNLQPGKYEVTLNAEMTMNGAQQTYPGRPSTRCVTPTQLSDPEQVFNKRFLVNYHPDPSCTRNNFKNSATALSYDEDCNNRSVHLDASLAGTSYNAVRKVVPKDPRAPQMTYKIVGKRTGDCGK